MIGRISDDELAIICDQEGYPSVGDRLVSGQSQEEATAYIVGLAPRFSDGGARWFLGYLSMLHGPAVYKMRYYPT